MGNRTRGTGTSRVVRRMPVRSIGRSRSVTSSTQAFTADKLRGLREPPRQECAAALPIQVILIPRALRQWDQDAWLRSSTAETVNVRSPRAYLMTVVTRLALDRLKSARATREQYIGPWLPGPSRRSRSRWPNR